MAKRKIKKLKKLSDSKKESLCVVAMFGLIAAVLIAASVMLLFENNFGNIDDRQSESVQVPQDEKSFEYEGWINCMPSPTMDEERAELCRRAEEAGYDKIAY